MFLNLFIGHWKSKYQPQNTIHAQRKRNLFKSPSFFHLILSLLFLTYIKHFERIHFLEAQINKRSTPSTLMLQSIATTCFFELFQIFSRCLSYLCSWFSLYSLVLLSLKNPDMMSMMEKHQKKNGKENSFLDSPFFASNRLKYCCDGPHLSLIHFMSIFFSAHIHLTNKMWSQKFLNFIFFNKFFCTVERERDRNKLMITTMIGLF